MVQGGWRRNAGWRDEASTGRMSQNSNPARTLQPSHDVQDIISSLQDGMQHHNQLVASVDLW
jgi:hypothetical protein